MTPAVIAWIAGLVEGEGCFPDSPKAGRYPRGRYEIVVRMADQDVIERLAAYWGTPVRATRPQRANWKPMYGTTIGGSDGIAWMFTLYPLLGIRRRASIRAIVSRWKTSRWNGRKRRMCRRGHPLIAGNLLIHQRQIVCRICDSRTRAARRNSFRSDARQGELA